MVLQLKWCLLKIAKQSFCTSFCWCNSAHTQGFLKPNMLSIEWSFYLLSTCTICVIFLYNWTQCIEGFNLLLQRYEKVTMQRTQQFSAFVCYQKNPVKCSEKLRPIALAETCRFLTIQWNLTKNNSETTWMIYHEKSEFWHREFLEIKKTIYGKLQKSPMSKFYYISVDRRYLMSICSGQMIKTI